MIYINYLTVSDNPVTTTSDLFMFNISISHSVLKSTRIYLLGLNSVGFAIMVNKVYLKNDNKYIVSVTY